MCVCMCICVRAYMHMFMRACMFMCVYKSLILYVVIILIMSVMALKPIKFHLLFKSVHLFIFLLYSCSRTRGVIGIIVTVYFLSSSGALTVCLNFAWCLLLMYFIVCVYLILCFFLKTWIQPAVALKGNCIF
jgi:hypothetical protein